MLFDTNILPYVIVLPKDSILLHAPFLNSKNSNKAILEGWNEYLNMYLAKKNKNLISTQANKLLTKLDEENYLKFKETNSYIKKK